MAPVDNGFGKPWLPALISVADPALLVLLLLLLLIAEAVLHESS